MGLQRKAKQETPCSDVLTCAQLQVPLRHFLRVRTHYIFRLREPYPLEMVTLKSLRLLRVPGKMKWELYRGSSLTDATCH